MFDSERRTAIEQELSGRERVEVANRLHLSEALIRQIVINRGYGNHLTDDRNEFELAFELGLRFREYESTRQRILNVAEGIDPEKLSGVDFMKSGVHSNWARTAVITTLVSEIGSLKREMNGLSGEDIFPRSCRIHQLRLTLGISLSDLDAYFQYLPEPK